MSLLGLAALLVFIPPQRPKRKCEYAPILTVDYSNKNIVRSTIMAVNCTMLPQSGPLKGKKI